MTAKEFDRRHAKKVRAIDEAIRQLEEDAKRNPPPKTVPRQRLSPEAQAHKDFCDDMQAIGDASGIPWGGGWSDLKNVW
jgi:hypothetical protein